MSIDDFARCSNALHGLTADFARAVSEGKDALVLECLAKDPSARPESADVLATRLAATVPAEAWTADAARA
jgi:hypothetical protein